VRTVCVMRAEGGADRLMEIFREYDLPAVRIADAVQEGIDLRRPGGLYVGVGSLRGGYEFPGLGLAVLCEREIFAEERKPADRKTRGRAAFISDFRDLKQGDLVVHVDHGVARYTGLGRPKGGSLNRDFMLLEFAGRDRLFVPTDRLDLVQRYSGVAGSKPSLDRLGGPSWERVKSKVRKSVRSMAKELLELYARRAAARGHAFAPDTPWQNELEAAFPFELTPDQDRVVAEVKAEMESDRAMDRLLVGDVGFGKTEVGVRAAFKAVMEGRQVALLTPTTVLAMQHFETFTARFAPFPVNVAMVSRFRSPAETRKILEGVALGTVDVLIGTHRMLSKDVSFKQLGLLLVDEEQRFGVAHKERLKAISVGVDVLAMTATPIPRTLQMSLAGVRDLSVIETPPPGRMAIQTYLVPFKKSVVAQAIRQELRPGLRRAQPYRDPACAGARDREDGSRGPRRHGPRTIAGAATRIGHAAFRERRGGHPRHDDDHRERSGYLPGEHDHRQPRRPLRPGPTLPVEGTGRPEPSTCLRVLRHSEWTHPVGRGTETTEGPGEPASCSVRDSTGISPRSGSTSTARCSSAKSSNSRASR